MIEKEIHFHCEGVVIIVTATALFFGKSFVAGLVGRAKKLCASGGTCVRSSNQDRDDDGVATIFCFRGSPPKAKNLF